MTKLLAIDPGNVESAAVLFDLATHRPTWWVKEPNSYLLARLRTHHQLDVPPLEGAETLAVEMIASYGMAVGREVFDTCVWIGRFIEAWRGPNRLVYRPEVKLHLTNSRRAKDANIRAALIDRYGPGKELAIGKKATPGPLYGLTGDCWSALAVAVTAAEVPDAA